MLRLFFLFFLFFLWDHRISLIAEEIRRQHWHGHRIGPERILISVKIKTFKSVFSHGFYGVHLDDTTDMTVGCVILLHHIIKKWQTVSSIEKHPMCNLICLNFPNTYFSTIKVCICIYMLPRINCFHKSVMNNISIHRHEVRFDRRLGSVENLCPLDQKLSLSALSSHRGKWLEGTRKRVCVSRSGRTHPCVWWGAFSKRIYKYLCVFSAEIRS